MAMLPYDSPMHPLVRLLTASFRLGRAFGSEVRVYGAALILALFVVQGLPLFAALSWGDRLLNLALSAVALYATVWAHEMGHVAAGWRWGIQTPLITLSPLGGLAHMQGAAPHPRAEIAISAAGPATHLLGLAVTYPLMLLVGGQAFTWSASATSAEGWSLNLEPVPFLLSTLVNLNVSLLLFNLLPLFPMDGGRILRALLSLRMHPSRATLWTARIGMVGAVALGVAGLLLLRGVGGGMLVAIAVTNFLACQRAALEARYAEGPYGARSAAWESDPDAWKLGAREEPETETGASTARATRPSRRRNERHGNPEVPTHAEVDRLLDRVREVGLAGLSDVERATLQRAAAARRTQSPSE